MSSAAAVAAAIREHDRFILTSHARPDGDAIGSQLAMAFALDALDKTVRLVNRDPAPLAYREFPGIDRIEIAERADDDADTAMLLECSDLTRPDVAGLERPCIINVDHHLGNAGYGTINWFDPSAAACGEMVADIIDALGVDWTPEIAAHLYLAISTDTGGFRYGPMSARTFDVCRRIAAAGVEPAVLSRQIFDSFSVGRVKLMGALLNDMELHAGDRVALLYLDEAMLAKCDATLDDTEGLVNLPLGARDVVGVALCKRQDATTIRVSLRSKGAIDVRAVALRWDGGGHRNAAGCTMIGDFDALKPQLLAALIEAVDGQSG